MYPALTTIRSRIFPPLLRDDTERETQDNTNEVPIDWLAWRIVGLGIRFTRHVLKPYPLAP